MRTINITGRTSDEFRWFVERIKTARGSENPGVQTAIELYEEIAAFPVSAGEIRSVEISDGVIKIRINAAVSERLEQAGLEESTNGWRISVAGDLVKDWRYIKDGEGAELILEGTDAALIEKFRANQL